MYTKYLPVLLIGSCHESWSHGRSESSGPGGPDINYKLPRKRGGQELKQTPTFASRFETSQTCDLSQGAQFVFFFFGHCHVNLSHHLVMRSHLTDTINNPALILGVMLSPFLFPSWLSRHPSDALLRSAVQPSRTLGCWLRAPGPPRRRGRR